MFLWVSFFSGNRCHFLSQMSLHVTISSHSLLFRQQQAGSPNDASFGLTKVSFYFLNSFSLIYISIVTSTHTLHTLHERWTTPPRCHVITEGKDWWWIVGPSDGPRYVFFRLLFVFTNNYLLSIRHQAHRPADPTHTHRPHPRSIRESVGSFSTHTADTAHPRCKRESVDRFCMTLDPRTPPSLQTRVGGVLSYILDHRNRPKRTPFGPIYLFFYINS